jgi:hypothetical protein
MRHGKICYIGPGFLDPDLREERHRLLDSFEYGVLECSLGLGV